MSQFPLTYLPIDVLFLIVEYISPKDKGGLSRISKYFRGLFESPQLWKNVTICVKSTRIKTCGFIMRILKKRKIKSVEFSVFDVELFKIVAAVLPLLENLSLQKTSSSKREMARALQEFSVCTNLKKLRIGDVNTPSWSGSMTAVQKLIECLPELESITLVSLNLHLDKRNQGYRDYTAKLRAALVISGRLKSVTLMDCEPLSVSLIKTILTQNHDLHTLKLCYTRACSWMDCLKVAGFYEGNTPADKGEEFKLKLLELSGSSKAYLPSLVWQWLTAGQKHFTNLKTLILTQCENEEILYNVKKFHTLERLDLTNSFVKRDILLNLGLPHLKWLELRGCSKVDGRGIQNLTKSVGGTLEYLGLANCNRLVASDLRNLPFGFSNLTSLDLSGNMAFCVEILQHWYDREKSHKCKMKRLVLKGCDTSHNAVREVCQQLNCNLETDC